ncbi:uncharacterized protein LOC130725578 [Lotus japonicus]|uniref:uncharacterized protein LOC130725578 n=1 Tax=Lotus japonicus TaxID=34305 RepID=UPI00258CE70B|nr:uncharacterized protein LOC130725578 [Lotus japonicus]
MDCEMETQASNPPDGGGGGSLHREKPPEGDGKTHRMSFRDKLMGGAKADAPKERVDLFEQGKMRMEFVGGDPRLPRIVVDKSVIENMCAPWKEALVVCLLGKKLGYRVMKAKLASTWRLSGDFELLDVGNGFFMVKFDVVEDRNKVIGGGPWMIFDHYLAVSTWSAEFISPAAKVKKTLAWIRIPGLNVAFYDESFLMSVAQVIGTPIRVDINTLRGERGRFARICVELDLSKPVYGKIMIEDYWYNIEYEGLHIICTKCGCYGHRSRECTTPPQSKVKEKEQAEPQMKENEMSVEEGANSTPPGGVAGGHKVQPEPRNDIETVAHEVMESPTIVATNNDDCMEVANSKEGGPQKKISNLKPPEEIFGEWMVVSKKKKKLTKQMAQKVEVKTNKDKGVNANHGQHKSKTNHGALKSKEVKSMLPSLQPKNVQGLKFGIGSGLATTSTSDTKKRRARGEEWETAVRDMKAKEIKMGPSSSNKIVFGGSSESFGEIDDYMARLRNLPANGYRDTAGSSRPMGITIHDK